MVSTDYYQAMKSKGIVMLSSTPEFTKTKYCCKP